MSRAARLARLEAKGDRFVMPRLTLGRTDRTEDDAVGFHHCPLHRQPGEAWSNFTERAWDWARDKPSFIGHILYRESTP